MSRAVGPRTWRVYVIEITPKWYSLVAEGLPTGKRCYYVGQTSKTLTQRYREHRTGRPSEPKEKGFNPSGRVFRKMRRNQGGSTLRRNDDTILRRSMTQQYEPVATEDEAKALENSLNDELREQGHTVYPKNDGSVPFENYRA